ncbi:MAG: cold shock domain-containing protein [Bacteroidetes bacterium]|nr:cold shock domain-containing protein [Bacteroidota bacterium]
MASSQETFNKRDKEKKRLKKRLDKQQKIAERKANSQGGGLDNMIAYVDENGHITDTPPNPANRKKIDASTIELGVPKRDTEEVTTIRKGRVDFFNHSRGFGFIKELDSPEKFFVHVNSLTEEIKEGDMVTFEIERSFKGVNAVRVKKV